MATTTSNFGWPIPQSTDLVKDGATAIASLGSGVDTSMAELKGGTTGQILSKTSGTDMDFTWITPNPGDITGVTAGTGLTGGGTSGDVTVSIDPTYYLLANQTRRNPIINSNFSVWQRGTSFTAADVYTSDRWRKDSQTYSTLTRQTTSDTTNLPTIQYCARVARNSGQTGTASLGLIYTAETVDAIKYAGQAVVVSFYARAGATYSAASSALNYNFYTGTGTDQSRSFASGFTGEANIASSSKTLTTTWQRFSFTATIGATATEWALMFYFNGVGTAGATDYFEITGVQLELGSTSNTYMPNQPTYQAELAACQRYYWRNTVPTATDIGYALGRSTTQADIVLPLPVTMRTNPTAIEYGGGTFNLTDPGVGSTNLTGFTFVHASYQTARFRGDAASGLTQAKVYEIGAPTNGYIGFSAEL